MENSWDSNTKKMTVKKLTNLAFFSTILIIFKFIFGFIPGVEFVTSLVIIFGILLPYKESLMLVVIFNIAVLIIYGFGTWWLVYWPLFLVDVTIGRVFRRLFKNRIYLAIAAFICGFSVLPWYFLSNLLWFGAGYAYAMIFSALPINLIEAFSNFIFCLIIAPVIVQILSAQINKVWGSNYSFEFKPMKKKKAKRISIIGGVVLSVTAITLLASYNSVFLASAAKATDKISSNSEIIPIEAYSNTNSNLSHLSLVKKNTAQGKYYFLSKSSIAFIYHEMQNSNDNAIVIIAKGKTYVDIANNSKNVELINYLIKSQYNSHSEWKFEYNSTKEYGDFLKGFYLSNGTPIEPFSKTEEDQISIWIDKLNKINTNDLRSNLVYSPLGASSLKLDSKDIYIINWDLSKVNI